MTCVLVVDDDTDIRGLVRELLERARLRGGGGARRRRGAARSSTRRSRTSCPRRLDAGPRRLRSARAHPRAVATCPVLMLTARADELEKVRGLRARRRRLRREAVRPPGAARARRGAAAPLAAREAEADRYADGFVADRLPAARGQRGGRERRADAARVPAALGLRPQPEPGALARPAARACVGQRAGRPSATR